MGDGLGGGGDSEGGWGRGWGSLQLMTADQLSRQRSLLPSRWTNSTFTPRIRITTRGRVFAFFEKGNPYLCISQNRGRSCLCPTLGSLVLDTVWKKSVFRRCFFFFFNSYDCSSAMAERLGGKNAFCHDNLFHTMNPSPLGKYKKKKKEK